MCLHSAPTFLDKLCSLNSFLDLSHVFEICLTRKGFVEPWFEIRVAQGILPT